MVRSPYGYYIRLIVNSAPERPSPFVTHTCKSADSPPNETLAISFPPLTDLLIANPSVSTTILIHIRRSLYYCDAPQTKEINIAYLFQALRTIKILLQYFLDIAEYFRCFLLLV